MAITRMATGASMGYAMTQVTAEPDGDYSPEPGDLWVLYSYSEPGVESVGPTGWTQAVHGQRTRWNGRDVDASVWWWWFPELESDQFYEWEWPTVFYVRANQVELELTIYRGIQPVDLATAATAATAVPN